MGGCQSAPTEAADGPQAQPQQQQRVKHQDQPNHTASSNVSTQPTLQPRHSFDRDATEVSRTTTSAAGTPAQNSVDRGAAGSTTTTTAGTTTTAASSTTITPEQLENINPNRPLPTDVDGLRTMVQQLQHALAVRELALQERERELQAEKAQRVQSATGVLNQAIKIIRPSTTAGSQKRESISSLGAERSGNNQMGISPSLIQLHERQKAAAAEAASAASDSAATISSNNPALSSSDSSSSSFSLSNPLPPTLERSPSILPTPVSSSSLQQQAAARDASGSLDSQEEESTLRRELMGVLLAFAENELIAPHSSGGGAGERKYSADGSERSRSGGPTQNFAAVINSSILDDTTKAWLTAEYTRDQPAMGAGTRQRHVSVFNAQRGQPAFAPSNTSSSNPDDFPQNGTSTPGGGSSSSSDSSGGEANHASMIYANSRLLISPDLVSLAELASWEFDPTSYTPELLIVQSFKMFESLDLLKRFAIDPVKLSNFMMELERNYIASNPYHNFRHGIDVLHCCWMYLRTSSVVAQARLRSLDLLAFMLSAVCHDLGHPGTTNLYQINTCSELAMVNFHAATTFRILAQPECNILSGLTREEWMDCRKIIISCILATDMSHHFSMVSRLDPLFDKLERITEANKLQAINVPQVIVLPVSPLNETANAAATASSSKEPESPVRPAAPSSSSLTTTSPSHSTAANSTSSSAAVAPIPLELTRDEITQLLNVLLHSADISNPGKPWRVAKVWSDRIQAENFSQGDLEKKRTLAISPFMDRAQENQPQTAINFIDFIVSPLMLAIVRAFPSLVPLAENLIKNRKIWHQSLLDRVSHSMRDATGSVLVAKEAERKSLTNKAQIFRTCFVVPVRKIAQQAELHGHSISGSTINGHHVSNTIRLNPSALAAAAGTHGHGGPKGTTIAEGDEHAESANSPPASIPGSASNSGKTSLSIAQPTTLHGTPEKSSSTSQQAQFQHDPTAATPGSATTAASTPTSTAPSTPAPTSGGAGSARPPLQPMARSVSAGNAILVSSPTALDAHHERVLQTADALFKSVSTIVKRRHSMLEGGTGARGNGVNQPNDLRAPQGSANLSLSQPHTPTLPRGRAGSSTKYVHTNGLTSHPAASSSSALHLILPSPSENQSLPRRVSLSEMAQAMLSGAPSCPTGSGLPHGESSDDDVSRQGHELLSPTLSPDSRAVAAELARKAINGQLSAEEINRGEFTVIDGQE